MGKMSSVQRSEALRRYRRGMKYRQGGTLTNRWEHGSPFSNVSDVDPRLPSCLTTIEPASRLRVHRPARLPRVGRLGGCRAVDGSEIIGRSDTGSGGKNRASSAYP